MKKTYRNLIIFALALSHIMCTVVAYNYSQMLCGIEHQGFSAPASTAFLTVIPFMVVISICLITAFAIRKRK